MGWKEHVHISTVACSNLVASFPLGRRERATRICSNWGKHSVQELCGTPGRATDEHLPVINGVGVFEGVKHGSDSRVLHVEGETSVAILELLDGLRRLVFLGIVLEGLVRTRVETRRRAASRTFWNLERNLDMVEKEREGGVKAGRADAYKGRRW